MLIFFKQKVDQPLLDLLMTLMTILTLDLLIIRTYTAKEKDAQELIEETTMLTEEIVENNTKTNPDLVVVLANISKPGLDVLMTTRGNLNHPSISNQNGVRQLKLLRSTDYLRPILLMS